MRYINLRLTYLLTYLLTYEVKAGIVLFACKTVRSMPVLQQGCCINPVTFIFYLLYAAFRWACELVWESVII